MFVFVFLHFVVVRAVICRFGECDIRSVDCASEPLKSDSNVCINGTFNNFDGAESACRRRIGANYSLISPGDAASNIEVVFCLIEGVF
jgi:hypothetical protein